MRKLRNGTLGTDGAICSGGMGKAVWRRKSRMKNYGLYDSHKATRVSKVFVDG